MVAARKLATFVHVNGSVYGPDDKVPADVAEQISNPKAWADSGDAEDDPGWSGSTVKELRAEIDSRNEGRDDADLIPSDGNKADLVAALEADDGK